MSIKIMLVSKMEQPLLSMRGMLRDEEFSIVGESAGGAAALESVENLQPDVLIMNLGAGDSDVLNLAERVIQHRPRTFVILLAQTLDLETMKQASAVGAHNVVEFPESQKEFSDYIKRVYGNETARLEAMSDKGNVAWASKVIAVYGAKGGLGKTTIAVNLAVALAAQHKKVALVDLDLQFGDVHIFLDIDPKETIAELVQEVYAPNIDSVRSYMTVHSSGVNVLCAPKSPEYAEIVSEDRVQSLLSLLRTYYDYVIIDTASNFSDVTMAAIEAASTVLFVTGLDISILKNSKLSMSILQSLQQRDKVRVVINRAVEINTISIADVQRIISAPIISRIPSDYMLAVSSLNRGVPFVTGAPNSKLSLAIGDIARLMMEGAGQYDIQSLPPKERKKLLKKYRSTEKQQHRPKSFRVFKK